LRVWQSSNSYFLGGRALFVELNIISFLVAAGDEVKAPRNASDMRGSITLARILEAISPVTLAPEHRTVSFYTFL
jgi:hypothetical protein